jgi:multiple sugar transport system permease protein
VTAVKSGWGRFATRWRGQIAVQVVLLLFGLAILLPFLFILASSFKSDGQFAREPMALIPNPPTAVNYVDATKLPLLQWGINTSIVVGITLVGQVGSSVLVAYPLALLRFRGRDPIFLLILATLMLPPQVLLIPQFLLFNYLGWVDTFLPLIVPSFFGLAAIYVFYLRQYFRGIPRELVESMIVEGAGHLTLLRHLIIPLSRPALVTVAILHIVFTYNDFFLPLIYLHSPEHFTLAVGIAQLDLVFGGSSRFSAPLAMAGAVIFVAPLIVMYLILNRRLTEGIQFRSGIS